MPDGRVMHASLRIGDFMLMLNDEIPRLWNSISAVNRRFRCDNPPNVDTAFNRAVSAGAQVKMPLADQFWGDRYGVVADPFGHKWSLGAHIKDMSPEEMQREQDRAMAAMKKKTA
jgi:PhnB protein